MSDTSGINSSGSQSGGSAQTDAIDAGQSDDIENSLTGQGVSDRETVEDIAAAQNEPPSPAVDGS
jgi:hypothetical protein